MNILMYVCRLCMPMFIYNFELSQNYNHKVLDNGGGGVREGSSERGKREIRVVAKRGL